ncbi:MAG: 16S rRNA (cytosine(1402)-N(4))-methyltransferase RsmH [Candidatus Omnitrophica bacterium]|nr:16S rRNA (cytosine(1402)-N(4))-methyltransferase RsmH [Candidatus Omnitrophota bacterium]
MTKIYHYPVMWQETLDSLQLSKREVIIDCTTGLGSHAYKMIQASQKNSFYIGIDKDSQSLKEAYWKLKPFEGRFVLLQEDFMHLDKVCHEFNIEKADIFFFDLGISTYQLANPQRGFSFLGEGALDMRINKDNFLTAFDLVNNLSEPELINIFKKFGEERYSRRIAHALVTYRRQKSIATTTQLAEIIEKSVPVKARFGRIHPATRVFQALRIAVNRELESLKIALPKAINFLKKGGRIGVISFHSLEDRIVKHTFKDFASRNLLKIITKKPKRPTEKEKKINPASRSAKLRIAEKIG